MSRENSLTLLIFIVIISLISAFFVYPPAWNKVSDFREWNLGLDLAGGSYLVYEVDLSDVAEKEEPSVVSGLRDVIAKRVNLFGVSEPRVYTQTVGNNHRIVAELPGVDKVNKAIKEIGKTPVLDFREVKKATSSKNAVATSSKKGSSPITLSTTSVAGSGTGTPSGLNFKKTELTGRYVKGAQVDFNRLGQPVVNIQLNNKGAKIFARLTKENVGEPIAIFLDGKLIQMPTVQEQITGGRAQISGDFSVEKARQLVQRFNAGALPAPIKLVDQKTISPTLGQDSLNKSIKAGLIGLAIVMLYMIAYYRKLGIFASVALLMYASLVLGIFKIIPITLTLSGIAAVILSVGMAVDANILVFERMEEELDRGLDYSEAVEEGFRRAWSSIRTTIISALVLFYITTGFVKGFALALIIGVLVSMFSAITITRTMLRVVYGKNRNKK
ncbi:MAG: protein translocase subunit SecD [Candidatus Magasanikbacteria bacterium]